MTQVQTLKRYENVSVLAKLTELMWAPYSICASQPGHHCSICGDTLLRFAALTDECPNTDHYTQEYELCGGRVRVPVADKEGLLVRFYDHILDDERTDLNAVINDLYCLWRHGTVEVMRTWESL